MSDTFQIDHEAKQNAAVEIAAHPERQALANLYTTLSIAVFVLVVPLIACVPAFIYWAYHVARAAQ